MPFSTALAKLTPEQDRLVREALAAMAAESASTQIAANIEAETAISVDDFATLLAALADGWDKRAPVTDPTRDKSQAQRVWEKVTRSHQFKGEMVPAAECPAVLGRAKSFKKHVEDLVQVNPGMGEHEASDLLKTHSGKAMISGWAGLAPTFESVALGKHVVWATFHRSNGRLTPLVDLPSDRDGLRSVLGLGTYQAHHELIFLVWDHVAAGRPPLHRPTVADAGLYDFYRPCADRNARWGLTKPLRTGMDGRPEVVLRECNCRGLLLPFQVF